MQQRGKLASNATVFTHQLELLLRLTNGLDRMRQSREHWGQFNIVSRKFDGKRMKEKHDLIWSLFTNSLKPEEWGKIALSIGASPEEIKAT